LKKIRNILFLAFALFFFSKNAISYVTTSNKSFAYTIDLEEKEPFEKTEKGNSDGKEKNEEWMISNFIAESRRWSTSFTFQYYQESNSISPYFEICPRPPERNLFS
jgi:hypothetical protein